MSIHINAKAGEIAPKVLLPGDPMRAKYIAENFLEGASCYNTVRGCFGFTGTYKGELISVQATGMGQPSLSIYVNELFDSYGVKTAIRVGTIGSIQEDVKVRDIIIAQGACTDSSIINKRFGFLHYAPLSDFELLHKAYVKSKDLKVPVHVGNVVSSDLFYDKSDANSLWKRYGVLGLEMESAELFMLAKEYKARALSIFTVSNSLVTGEETSSEDREKSFNDMIKLGLETLVGE